MLRLALHATNSAAFAHPPNSYPLWPCSSAPLPRTHTRARAHTHKRTHAPHPPLQIKIEDGEEAYLENQIGKLATDTQGQPIPYVAHRAFALPAHFDTEAPVTRSALQSLSGATRTFGGGQQRQPAAGAVAQLVLRRRQLVAGGWVVASGGLGEGGTGSAAGAALCRLDWGVPP